ncbi:unnamed protein product [Strongylus vulgaris]|uniref:Uncharacterized protein n=1 Tax=Strongylus vulgaris TaxID=40348 RepID=A0A3P7I3P0_STRVU|nr:unnamed protein product [Strongylus vulgaris]
MSRETSKSPGSETRAFVPEEGDVGSAGGGRLSFSTPMTASIPPIEIEIEDNDREKDKKWNRKSLEEHKPKRKDTTTFSNFLHRFTRSEDKKEDKQKNVIAEGDALDRPDKLQVPDSEEKWFEMKPLDGGFRTALDMGKPPLLHLFCNFVFF